MRFKNSQPGSLKFMMIAIAMMVVVDWLVFGLIPAQKPSEIVLDKQRDAVTELSLAKPDPTYVYPEEGDFFEMLPVEPEEDKKVQIPKLVKPQIPLRVPKGQGRSKVAIIIDDLGMDVKRSNQTIGLPAPLTLAFLPYAEKTRPMASDAKDKGHELIIHAPMEPMNADIDLGPISLTSDMNKDSIEAELDKMFQSFEGYVGLNNHMGSKLTQNQDSMRAIMDVLCEKDLFFVDSKTIHASIAAQTAYEQGVRYAVRDVFLDHKETKEFVKNALRKVEKIAIEHGSAIAIGHPKDVTIQALQSWIPTLKDRGFDLVPVSELLLEPKTTNVENQKPAVQDTKITVQKDDSIMNLLNAPPMPISFALEPQELVEQPLPLLP